MSETAIKVTCSICGESQGMKETCTACGESLPQEAPCDICGIGAPHLSTCTCGAGCCDKCLKSHGCLPDQDNQNYMEFHPKGGYKVFRIPKRDGSYRLIEEPNPELKDRQKHLLKMLLRLLPTLGPHAHGFVRFRSIVTNARRHFRVDPNTRELLPPQCLLKVDLRDFFPSVTSEMVWRAAREWKIPQYLAEAVQETCFRDNRLPQGAPTSPFLANLAATRLDFRLAGLSKKWRSKTRYQNIQYSRYADDLSFSSDYPRLIDLVHPIRSIVGDCGFTLHNRKIEFHRQPAQLRICGIVVNHKISVERKYWRGLRATIHGAKMDNLSGTVPKGHYLSRDGRKKFREAANIKGAPGLAHANSLPVEALEILATLPTEPIPWEQWGGKVSFIKSVDAARGEQLSHALEELRRICG